MTIRMSCKRMCMAASLVSFMKRIASSEKQAGSRPMKQRNFLASSSTMITVPSPRSLRFSVFSILIAMLIAPGVAVAAADSFVVSTTAGQLRGVPHAGGGAQFLGIPYAEPPLGNLRWSAPLPARHWTGTRNADAYGAPCMQPELGESGNMGSRRLQCDRDWGMLGIRRVSHEPRRSKANRFRGECHHIAPRFRGCVIQSGMVVDGYLGAPPSRLMTSVR